MKSSYADFSDFAANQRIAVIARWFILIPWLAIVNIHGIGPFTWLFNTIGITIGLLNAYVHFRILKGKPISYPYVLALSLMDLCAITGGILITDRFKTSLFIFYYPALLAAAAVLSTRVSFMLLAGVATAYAIGAIFLPPRINTTVLFGSDEKELTARLVSMLAVVVAGNLIVKGERERRREAVDAERARLQENSRLQDRLVENQREALRERIRISEEIHDGAAQSTYVLRLGLESCEPLVRTDQVVLRDKLEALEAQCRQTLWELRYAIDLVPVYEGKGLARAVEDHVKNFITITSIPTTFNKKGSETDLPIAVTQRVLSIAHNALGNASKYSRASQVTLGIVYREDSLELSVEDDGIGFDTLKASAQPGHGIRNMRRAAEEVGGRFLLTSAPGKGTVVGASIPFPKEAVRV